jgi:hypothetical protein
MSHRFITTAVLCSLLVILAACGSGPSADVEAIDVKLTTAQPAFANEETTLVAELSGYDFPESTVVRFDIRLHEDIIPRELKSVPQGDNVYTTTYTFPEPGVYDVYVHIYIDDLHLIKMRQVEVQ